MEWLCMLIRPGGMLLLQMHAQGLSLLTSPHAYEDRHRTHYTASSAFGTHLFSRYSVLQRVYCLMHARNVDTHTRSSHCCHIYLGQMTLVAHHSCLRNLSATTCFNLLPRWRASALSACKPAIMTCPALSKVCVSFAACFPLYQATGPCLPRSYIPRMSCKPAQEKRPCHRQPFCRLLQHAQGAFSCMSLKCLESLQKKKPKSGTIMLLERTFDCREVRVLYFAISWSPCQGSYSDPSTVQGRLVGQASALQFTEICSSHTM